MTSAPAHNASPDTCGEAPEEGRRLWYHAPRRSTLSILLAALAGVAHAEDPPAPAPTGPLTPEEDEPGLPVPGAPDPEPEAPGPEPAPTEPAPGAPAAFNYDTLLVTTVQPEAPEFAADAAALEELLLKRFGATNQLVPMSSVPFFDVQGYDGKTYMLGCPPGRYAGCALVIGQRTEVDRTVGATIRREPDPGNPAASYRIATFHILDVAGGVEVVSVAVPMPDGLDEDVVSSVIGLFDEVVEGDLALKDLRERSDPGSKELTEARKERMAQALDRLEEKLGTAVVSEVEAQISRPKLTKKDLAEYEGRDDQPPWERVGMGPGEYLRFANSGDTYEGWQTSGWGRTGSLLVRIGGGGGAGPWDERYVGQVLLSDEDLQPVDSAQLLEVVRGGSPNFDFEVGVGVLPFLEVDFAGSVRPGTTSYQYDEDVQNQIPLPSQPDTLPISTWQFGGRVHFAPFPRWVARPTVGLGVASWKGAGIPAQQSFDRIDAPKLTFLELLPGAEVSASPHVVPWIRANLAVPLGGTTLTQVDGGGGLVEKPKPSGDPGMGVTVQVGLQIRVGPFVKPPTALHPR